MRLVAVLAACALAGMPGTPGLNAQGSTSGKQTQTAVALHPELLPKSFEAWRESPDAPALDEPTFALVNARKEALEESGPERSAVKSYQGPGGKVLRVEAAEFRDATGALAAFSLLAQPGMRELKNLGSAAAAGDGGVLFVSGAAVAVAFPASAADLSLLQALAEVMPKPVGAQALRPLLPALLPERGLQPGSVRYALGPRGYMAEGGVLPAAGLGWDKEAEAVTAKYADRRGAETLTLVLYPTPTIAGPHLRQIEAELPGMGPSFNKAKARREGSLVLVANGTFSPDAAQALVENTHLHQLASTDKSMPTPEVVETRQTFSTLANVILFSGLLGVAALGVGLMLGGGRALVRVMRGKPAATEAEFLSLHLDPQNPTPVFGGKEAGGA